MFPQSWVVAMVHSNACVMDLLWIGGVAQDAIETSEGQRPRHKRTRQTARENTASVGRPQGCTGSGGGWRWKLRGKTSSVLALQLRRASTAAAANE